MIKKLRATWKNHLVARRIKKRHDLANKRLAQVESRIDSQRLTLTTSEKRLKSLFRAMYDEIETLEQIAKDARYEVNQAQAEKEVYERQIMELREELRIANDVTIPGLVKSHANLTEIYNADISAQVRRQSALQVERIE
jgi:predicted  nucleic acid-binding Zn-ribbon protein